LDQKRKAIRERKERQHWKNIQARGKKKYIWFDGVLLWGVSMAIVWSLLLGFSKYGFAREAVFSTDFLTSLLIALIIFPVGIFLQAVYTWNKYEKKYGN